MILVNHVLSRKNVRHVEHVGGEGDGANLGHTRRAVAPHKTQQRIDAPHALPLQGAVEQRGVDSALGSIRLVAEELSIDDAKRLVGL